MKFATSESGNEARTGSFIDGRHPLLSRSLADPDVLANPHAYYHALRIGDPVHYDARIGMYLVSRYEDLQTILRDPITFSQERGWQQQFARGYFQEFKEILVRSGGGYFPEAILVDPPRHGRVRRLLQNAFTPRRIALLEPRIRAVIGELIERVADRGHADGVNDLAMPMTVAIMCEQLGLDQLDGEKVARWSRAYTAQVGGMQDHETMLHNASLVCELQNFIIARVRERQEARTEDMISDLIYAKLDDEEAHTLSFGEIVALARALLVGGNDTTATALSNLMLMLATRPEIAAKLEDNIGDNRRLGRFIEELLRIEPPVRCLFRVTTRNVEVGGTLLPEGSYICMLFASGNDDEAIFRSPREFDMDRPNLGRHISFGAGVHLCVGMTLARMELKVAAQEIVTRLKDIRLAVAEVEYVPNIALLSLKCLPLKFSRRQ